MKLPPVAPTQPTPPGAPFQYSLRTMFILTTVLAVAVSLLFAVPPVVRLVAAAFFALLLPSVVTVVLIYGRGYARTFCVGAIFPAGVSIWPFQSGVPLLVYGLGGPGGVDDVGYVPGIWIGVTLVVSLVFGLIAMGVRWLVEASQLRRQREASVREHPPQRCELPDAPRFR